MTEEKIGRKKVIACVCGNDVSSMNGCKKKANQWYCKKCGERVTKQKLEQLVQMIKDNL